MDACLRVCLCVAFSAEKEQESVTGFLGTSFSVFADSVRQGRATLLASISANPWKNLSGKIGWGLGGRGGAGLSIPWKSISPRTSVPANATQMCHRVVEVGVFADFDCNSEKEQGNCANII